MACIMSIAAMFMMLNLTAVIAAICHKLLIQRDWYELGTYNIDAQGRCGFCAHPLAGRFANTKGDFGSRRIALKIK